MTIARQYNRSLELLQEKGRLLEQLHEQEVALAQCAQEAPKCASLRLWCAAGRRGPAWWGRRAPADMCT